ncbi:MFS transporter [Spongiactinospora sp. TRM90649]|uniref:MFS transporter n=1 Tax=Spongiactinospora sp. TRM90649 TaxID=3031114 RepID=UPI0023FA4774|nr:MFS transporter [Spongiactinospora sp. TRM90649]MDF5757029.1 MFS transporter [Spongiactinospora sp. TRM90649]
MTSPDIAARVCRKNIRKLAPFLGLLYLIAYIDRNNVGFAKLGMSDALGLSASVFGFAAGVFFIGYFLFEVPSNLVLAKVGARKWIARIMITWGLVTAATAFVQGPVSFSIARFLLGAAEAGFFPGVLLYLTFWFPQHYRSTVIAVFALSNPLANAISAPVSGWLVGIEEFLGLAGWQLVFVVEAIPAVLLAFVVFYWLPDKPADARWLNAEERDWLDTTLAAEAAATERRHGRLRFSDTLRHPRLWALIAVFFGIVFATYGLGLWLPTIVQDLGDYSPAVTGWLVALPNLVAVCVMLPWERRARRRGDMTRQIGVTLLIGSGALLVAVLGAGTPWVAMAALCVGISAMYAATPLFWSTPSTFLTGVAIATGLAFINSVGNLAGFAGPYAIGWLTDATGSPSWGLVLISVLTAVSATVAFVLARRETPAPAPAAQGNTTA